MQFVHLGPVNFDTLVFHTGTGEIHKLGFYFNEHIVSIVVLNAMFNNSSSGDRARFDQASCTFYSTPLVNVMALCDEYCLQAPELRLFNMQESETQGTLGRLNQVAFPLVAVSDSAEQVLHLTADQVCRQQEMDHQHQVKCSLIIFVLITV